jgi:hypothetical protein
MPDTGKELAAKRGVEYNPADESRMRNWPAIMQTSCTVNMALKHWQVPLITGAWVTLIN